MNTISKLGSRERQFISKSNLLDWHHEKLTEDDFLDCENTLIEKKKFKVLKLHVNSNLKKPEYGKPTKELIKYFISLTDVVNLDIDYHTIENPGVGIQAKFILDHCIEIKKHIRLCILVEKKINVQRLVKLMDDG